MKKAAFTSVRASVALFLIFFVISFSFIYFPPMFVHAQTIGTTSLDGIDIQASPSNPTPGSNVTVSLVSYATNLSAANISWSVGGKKLTNGTGIESITVTAPPTGKNLQIMATINTAEGADIQKEITVSSGDVDMVWETSEYVPPLYQGKTPFTYQGTVTVIAMPHLADKSGNTIDPKDLIYQWKENTFTLGSASGYGKQSIKVTGSVIAQPLSIDVTVSSIDGSVHAEGHVTLNPISPSIVFYQDDPLYGVLYNDAIGGTLYLVHNQTKIIAAPYGFNIPGSNFVYNWSINGALQGSLSASRSAVLGVAAGQQGSSNIDLSIQNTAEDILQTAESSFNAVFSDQSTTTSSAIF